MSQIVALQVVCDNQVISFKYDIKKLDLQRI